MKDFFSNNDWILILLAVIILLAGAVFFIYLFEEKRKKKIRKAEKEKQPDPVNKIPQKSPKELFTSELTKTIVVVIGQSKKLKTAADAYEPTKGNDYDQSLMTDLFFRNGLLNLPVFLEKYQELLKTPGSTRLVKGLLNINSDIKVVEESMKEFLNGFLHEYKKAMSGFAQNILELSKLHDELSLYSKGKKLKPDVAKYVDNYTSIFKDWASTGAEKTVVVMRNELSLKILALNRMYPQSPFIKRTDECALKCEGAYEAIKLIDDDFDKKVKNYQRAFKKTVAALKIILAPPKTQSTDAAAHSQEGLTQTTQKEASPAGKAQSQTPTHTSNASAQPPKVKTEIEVKPLGASSSGPVTEPSLPKKKKWSPQRWATTLVLSLLGLALLSWAGIYFYNKLNPAAEVPLLHSGYSIPEPAADDRFESHDHHLQVIKPILDSLRKEILIASLVDSLQNNQDSLTQFRLLPHDGDSIHVESTRQRPHRNSPKIDSTYIPLPKDNNPQPEYGVDVSHYQGDIDWGKLAADTTDKTPIRFVIMKASEGTRADPRFTGNWEAANKSFSKVGAYHFFSFGVDPLKQAEFFIQNVSLQPGNIRPIIDVESNCSECFSSGKLTHEQVVENVKTFLKTIEAHYNCKAIIYTGNYYYEKYLTGNFPDNDFWLAEYSKDKSVKQIIESHIAPKDNETAVMWQFTSSGSVDGIEGKVDMNYLPSKYLDTIVINK